MNKVYRTVFNEKTNTWVAVAETAKAHGKSGRSGGVVAAVADGMFLSKKMLAVSAAVAAAMAAQPAMADNARIENGSANWTIAISPNNSTAGNGNAKATGPTSIAAGWNATATGDSSIAVGYDASTETDPISATDQRVLLQPTPSDKTLRNIAIGAKSKSGGLQTIAFGSESYAARTQSIAMGYDSQATGDQSVALGANTRAQGASSVAIGGDDLDSVASTVYRQTSATADNDAYNDTPVAQQYRALTGQNLVNFTPGNRYISTTTGQAGVAVGVSSKAGDLATAIGTKSHATGDHSVALGVGANTDKANAVVLGAGSTTATNATDVPSATVGSITYGSAAKPFAGSGKVVSGDQVSVGSAGYERQIKHVAPGAITDTSTDAINGSQLFYVTQGLQNQIGSLGFGVNADNNSLKTHQLGKELAIVAGNTTESTSTDNLKTNVIQDAATGKTTVTVSMKEAPTFSSVTTQDAAGNKTVTNAGGVTITPVSGSPVSLTKDGLNNGGNKITGVADGNIAAGSKEAVNGSQLHDLKEKGFKIAADNGTPDTVKLTETVKYTGDSNIVTTVKDNEIGFKLANSITVGPAAGGNPVTVDGNAGTVTGLTNKTWNPASITSGRAATEDQLKAAQAAATTKVAAGNGISVNGTQNADGSTTYKVAAATTPLTVTDGKVDTPAAGNANKLATAGDIADAINNSGFNINAGGNVVGTSTATIAKPGSTLTLKAGDGLSVEQELDANGNQSYTYALDAQAVVQNAQAPVVYTKADGTKVYKRPDGKFYDAPTGGTQVAAGDVIASMQDAAGNTTAPTTLANVKSNLADAAAAATNPANNDRAALTANNKGNNAATVNDVLNAGFTVQGNGQDKDFVTHGDTVNFANGQGTVANVTSTNGVTTVKFDTPMTYVNASGNPTGTPSNKVNLVGGDATKPVTLGNVADGTVAAGSKEAVNGSQLHATNQNVANNAANIAKGINFGGTTGSNNYQLGDTINVKGDSNITSTTVAGGAQLALNPNLNVTSVTTTDAAGNKTVTNGSGVTITPAAGNSVSLTTGGLNNGGNKITNVAAGTAGTDAVNVDQLKVAKAAATTKVKAGNGISVNGTQNADGSTTYTVAADTTPLTVSNGKVTPPAAANKLATAGDIANAINNSGFNINAGGNVVGTSTATTAKPGSTLTLKAGDGLTVKQELDGNGNQSYTYALDAQTVVQNAQAPVVYTKADGTKVYKRPDGKFYDAPTGGNEVAAGNVIASMQDAAGNTTKPTTLANVKSNLADTATAVTNPNGNKRTDLAGKGNNAATVNDVLNAGFTVQGNGQNKDFVTHGDTVNFANGQGTVANVTSTNGVTTVKFDTPMTYVNASGSPTGTPSNKVNLVGGDATKPVTLGNVADGTVAAGSKEAVNGSQLHATNQNVANNAANIAKGINFGGTTGSNNYRLGDTINVKGDSNITSTTVAGGAQLALNRNLNVTSVTTTDTAGNKTVTNGSGVTITPASGNSVSLTAGGLNNGGNKITNVAEGTAGTDAVNVSQLNKAIGAIAGPNTANFTALNNKVNEVAADAKAGTAAAMAVAGLPQAYLPGKSMMAVGGSVYRGESGYAIGYSTISDGGNWIIKGTATGNSRGHYGATAAVGYQW